MKFHIVPNAVDWLNQTLCFLARIYQSDFFTLQDSDPDFADLLICIGTSLEVYPFANLADLVPDNVVRVLINRDTVGSFGRRKNDIILNGDIIDIVHKLEQQINW
jgi:NAD-dependent SIR2 family protein deacetylase